MSSTHFKVLPKATESTTSLVVSGTGFLQGIIAKEGSITVNDSVGTVENQIVPLWEVSSGSEPRLEVESAFKKGLYVSYLHGPITLVWSTLQHNGNGGQVTTGPGILHEIVNPNEMKVFDNAEEKEENPIIEFPGTSNTGVDVHAKVDVVFKNGLYVTGNSGGGVVIWS